MSIQRLTEEVEELTTELHGPMTAVSVDEEGEGWRVRLWDPKGNLIDETQEPLTKERALREMVRRLTS